MGVLVDVAMVEVAGRVDGVGMVEVTGMTDEVGTVALPCTTPQ